MEKTIDIAELLKDAPMMTTLYSPVFGKVSFNQITGEDRDIEVFADNTKKHFSRTGKLIWHGDDNILRLSKVCLLFPSENCQTWENFKVPWLHKHFKPFEKVLIHRFTGITWEPDLYFKYKEGFHYTFRQFALPDDNILPYEGNEDKLGKDAE